MVFMPHSRLMAFPEYWLDALCERLLEPVFQIPLRKNSLVPT
jgi:hypothetical protein